MRVDPIEYEDLEDEELREIFANMYRNRGADVSTLPNHYKVEAHFPRVMEHLLKAVETVKAEGDLEMELAQKISVAVSMANQYPYCTGVYCSLLNDEVGGEEMVREFQQAFEEGELSRREADIIEFAVKMNDEPHTMTDSDFDALREEHGLMDRDFVQTLFIVNVVNGYNRVTNAFDCEMEDVYHDSPWLGV
jgi:uncharacterized peroxidase-related enzyme